MPIAKHGAEQEVWKVQKEICKRREIFPNFLGELQTQIRKVQKEICQPGSFV